MSWSGSRVPLLANSIPIILPVITGTLPRRSAPAQNEMHLAEAKAGLSILRMYSARPPIPAHYPQRTFVVQSCRLAVAAQCLPGPVECGRPERTFGALHFTFVDCVRSARSSGDAIDPRRRAAQLLAFDGTVRGCVRVRAPTVPLCVCSLALCERASSPHTGAEAAFEWRQIARPDFRSRIRHRISAPSVFETTDLVLLLR